MVLSRASIGRGMLVTLSDYKLPMDIENTGIAHDDRFFALAGGNMDVR